MFNVQTINLKGGGTLVYQKSNRNKSTSVSIGFAVGTRFNTQNGIAHFSEHLLFKGTNKRTTEKLEKDLREYCGNSFNASTGQDSTLFEFNRVNSLLENAFEIASDIFLNSNVLKKYVDSEKNVILEEYNVVEDERKYGINAEHFSLMLNTSLDNRLAVGNKEDLDKITAKSIVEFRKNFYTRENFIVSVVGSERLSKIKHLVNKYFLKNLPNNSGAIPLKHETKVVGHSAYQILKKETDNVLVNISFKTIGHSDIVRRPALLFFKEYLTGGVDGMLFKAVRDKGFAYDIDCGYLLLRENGLFTVSFETSKQNVNKVIDEIAKVFNDIRKKGFDIKEIEKTKRNFEYYLNEKDETNLTTCIENALNVILDIPFEDEEYLKNVLATKKQVIDEYFQDLLSENNEVYVTIGGKIKQSEVYNLQEIKQKMLK